jgi:hypothetical protein
MAKSKNFIVKMGSKRSASMLITCGEMMDAEDIEALYNEIERVCDELKTYLRFKYK